MILFRVLFYGLIYGFFDFLGEYNVVWFIVYYWLGFRYFIFFIKLDVDLNKMEKV